MSVSVLVPKGFSASGAGIAFNLPEEVVHKAGHRDVRVSLPNGAKLPVWIQFNPEKFEFELGSVPASGLPLTVMLQTGNAQILVLISERMTN